MSGFLQATKLSCLLYEGAAEKCSSIKETNKPRIFCHLVRQWSDPLGEGRQSRVWQGYVSGKDENTNKAFDYVCKKKCRGFVKVCFSWKHPFYRNAISSIATIKAFRKWIYLGWFKLVLLFLCIKFVDKLILPLFLVHTVFMILSLLCALTSPLPSPLLFPREQIKGATIHKIICF